MSKLNFHFTLRQKEDFSQIVLASRARRDTCKTWECPGSSLTCTSNEFCGTCCGSSFPLCSSNNAGGSVCISDDGQPQ